MATKGSNNNYNLESIMSSIWDLGYTTSQYLAYCVGMGAFGLTALILLSTMSWCCIFLPPVAVFFRGYVRDGNGCTEHVIYNMILCFFLWVPGVIHAFWYCFMDFSGFEKTKRA